MDIRSLRYFLAIANTGSVTKASEYLNTTQPNLTRQLHDLEAEIKKPLFIRGKQMILTEEGQFLYKRASELIELFEKTESDIKGFGKESRISGMVKIGSGESFSLSTIAKTTKKLLTKHKDIRFSFYSGDTMTIIEKLNKGVLDFGILVGPANLEDFESIHLPLKDIWGLLLHKEDALANKKALTAKDIEDLPLIISTHALKSSLFQNWFTKDIKGLNIVATYNLLYNATLLVKERVGYALALDKIANTSNDSGLVFRPLEPTIHSHLDVVYRKNQTLSRACRAFLTELKAQIETEKESSFL